MNIKQNILEQVCSNNACTLGIDKLLDSSTKPEFIDCYFQYIDFCLAKKAPSVEFIRSHFENKILTENGVYANATDSAHNLRRCAIIGKSDMVLDYTGYSVGRVYVADSSRAEINATGNAYVVVDAIDAAEILVKASEDARVTVNAYSGTKVSGNAIVIHKNTTTYEL